MSRLLSTSALALVALASPVFAELTPAQVWDRIVESQTRWGYEVTEGAREEAGDTLTVTDVKLRMVTQRAMPAAGDAPTDAPADEPATDGAATDAPAADAPATDAPTGDAPATDAPAADAATAPPPADAPGPNAMAMGEQVIEITLPKVVLTQTGDGGVRTVYDGDITGRMDVTRDGATAREMDMTLAMPGNEMVTTGTPEAMRHVFAYPTIDGNMTFRSPGEGTVPVTLALAGLKGSYDVQGASGAAQATTYDMTGDTASITFDMPPVPGAEGATAGAASGKVALGMTALASRGELASPAGTFDLSADANAALKAGLSMDGTLSMGGLTLDADTTETNAEGRPENTKAKLTVADLSAGFGLSADGLTYETASGRLDAEMTMPGAPMPVTYGMASTKMDFAMPLTAAEAAQPFALAYALTGVTLGDAIWGMVDPAAQIPRDPMDLAVDLAGDVLLNRDLMDPAFAQEMESAAAEGGMTETPAIPFDLRRLAVNAISLKAAGATADVKGTLTAPEGGTFDTPLGTLTANVTGANALIDRLSALGFVPAEQVAGVKMMLMAFAKPVEGQEDAYTTEFEFREGGTIFANGQQVK